MTMMKKGKKVTVPTVLTFIIIFVSNDTLLFGTNANRLFFWIHVGILLATLLYMLAHTKKIDGKTALFASFLIVMIVLTFVVNFDTSYIKYIYNIFMILLCVLFCKQVSKTEFCKSFTDVVFLIAVFATVLFFLWIVAAPVMRLFPSIRNESDLTYYFYGFGFLEELYDGVIPRMYGIFREPGVFTCYLVLATIIELFFLEKLNIKHILGLTFAALLTFSTAAYILLALVFIGYFIRQLLGNKEHKHKAILILLVLLTLVVTAVFAAVGPERIISIVFNKLAVKNSSRDSRFSSITANWQMFLKNPFLGKGWKYVEENFNNYASLGEFYGRHNTNTFLKILALYGIAPFAALLSRTFLFFRKGSKSAMWGALITALWFITLCNEDMSVNILVYLIPFYAYEYETPGKEMRYANAVD